jgi:hypothetical protein
MAVAPALPSVGSTSGSELPGATMQCRLALIVVLSLVATASVAIISAPAAQATDTTGFTTQVFSHSAGIDAGARVTLTQSCPAGSSPIAGGVSTASPAVYRYEDNVEWGDGAEVAESVQNTATTPHTATVYADPLVPCDRTGRGDLHRRQCLGPGGRLRLVPGRFDRPQRTGALGHHNQLCLDHRRWTYR